MDPSNLCVDPNCKIPQYAPGCSAPRHANSNTNCSDGSMVTLSRNGLNPTHSEPNGFHNEQCVKLICTGRTLYVSNQRGQYLPVLP